MMILTWERRLELPLPIVMAQNCSVQHGSHDVSKVFDLGKLFCRPSTKKPTPLRNHGLVHAGIAGMIAVMESS